MPIAAADLSALVHDGLAHLPGQPEYELACQPWNVAVAQRPPVVGVPTSVQELVLLVQAAVGCGLRVAPQSTGHAAAALPPDALDNTLLLRLHRLTGVQVDPLARTARILGGTQWSEVLAACAPHGLTAVHGSAGDVSAVGFLLGGGISFYGRAYGLGSSTVREIEVVTADGALRRVSATEEPDLFWAIRGGGGSFGVVVTVEIDLLPLPDVVAGMLLWDLDAAPRVLPAWAQWTLTAPESATTSLRLMRFPPAPELPDAVRGRRLVVIDGAVLGSDNQAAEILAPLRELRPELDTFARIPSHALTAVHMDPPGPTPIVADHALLGELPAAAVAALLSAAGPDADTSLMFAELRHLGGALGRDIDAALPRVDAGYALFAAATADTPDLAARALNDTADVVAALAPWSTGTSLGNFDDRPGDASTAFCAAAWSRLQRVRERYDPQQVWVAVHEVTAG
ncbi:FAD-binding oxidoreductase [Mycolicibacter hiberniae]|uniref:FAD-linked oxidase n=1 Tax=Mycolicibacter hiberniae TaxID=29314 RepID=A0A7I7WZ68_9MYCO|nr:FAD-binding protein [Mycolicibacter hiberniae]MCV7086860.1 FAD-binding protein [Mycolicibacter hiberniae]ORV70892.1 FAD-linked oxidase [Mycolicibacter hiberniae]BBZ21841.1 FAD-linked oxidase [Mycolicibacter hiberniae]